MNLNRWHADHKADLVYEFLLDISVERSGLLIFACSGDGISIVPYCAGSHILGIFVVEVHADTLALLDKDSISAILEILREFIVQEPLKVENLRCHSCLDMLLAGKGAKPLIDALQRMESTLHKEYKPPPRKVVRN